MVDQETLVSRLPFKAISRKAAFSSLRDLAKHWPLT
jgi:hypothetical protein